MGWRFEWIREWPRVWDTEFQATWRHIQASDPLGHVYHRPDLVRAWAETRGREVGAQAMVGIASDEVGRRVLLPWVSVSYPGRFTRRRVLEPAGQSLFGYHDPLVDGYEADTLDWPAFWEAARRASADECDQALFRFVDPRYGRGPRSEPCGEVSPVLNLVGVADLDACLSRCSAKHRGDVRRQMRRLEEKGQVTLWVAGPTEADEAARDFTDRFVPAYRDLWGARPAEDMLTEPGMTDFLERVIRSGIPSGWAHYAVLRVDGVPIAWHLGLLHQDELYWWMPTYDAAWETLSPGKTLLARLIEHSIAQRWRRVHFLTGGQWYKLAWKPEIMELRAVRWHAPTVAGALCACYDAVRRRRGAVKALEEL
jgi:CelD/BcsL family acetyltransferase involved in cellulose biosynthesis